LKTLVVDTNHGQANIACVGSMYRDACYAS
jgi:hypothetical protein